MFLEHLAVFVEQRVNFRIFVLQLGNRKRCARTGHNIFALRVHQEFTIEHVLARGSVASECHARAGIFTHVPEHHGLHADSGSPCFRNVIHLAVGNRAFVVPGTEHRADSAPHLFHRIVRKIIAGLLFDRLLEKSDQFFQVIGGQFCILMDSLCLLFFLDDDFERIDFIFVHRFQAKHDIAVHLHKAAVRIVHEARIIRLRDHPFGHNVVQAEIQNGIHHTRHRCTCAGTDGDKKRIFRIVEFCTHRLLNLLDGGFYFAIKRFRIGLLVCIVMGADFGGDRQAGGYRQTDIGHFGEVRTFAAEEILHLRFSFCLAAAEEVDIFSH